MTAYSSSNLWAGCCGLAASGGIMVGRNVADYRRTPTGHGFTQATRAEAGNIFFEWSMSVDVPNQFVLVEAFADGAGEAHVTSEHFTTAIAWWRKVIARKPEIINIHVPQDGRGEMAEMTRDNSP